jgi:sugar lactone lactonase YvrE
MSNVPISMEENGGELMNVLTSRRRFLQWGAMAMAAPLAPWQTASQQKALKVTTIAGTGMAGSAADGASAESAPINNPYGLVIGPDGALYWADFGSNRVLSLNLNTRKISVVAGTGAGAYSGDGGPARAAALRAPHEVRFDSKGDIYVAERDNHVVRKINMKSGMISTFAGTGVRGFSGDGGPANQAQLAQPHSIALDKNDNVFICDIVNNRVRRVDGKTGIISTFAGTGDPSPTPDETALAGAPFRGPRSIDIDSATGTMYLILREGNKVFAVDPAAGRAKRLAGTGELGYSGDGGPALNAKFGAPGNALNGPKGIGFAADGMLYIVDTENHVIRRIDTKGIVTTVMGTGQRGDGPDGDPLTCKLSRPHGVFVSGRKIYIGDSESHRIRLLE